MRRLIGPEHTTFRWPATPGVWYNDRMVRQIHIGTDGDIHLPEEMCHRFGWRVGDRLLIEAVDKGILLRRVEETDDTTAMGEAGLSLSGEVLPVEDFSDWMDGNV